MTYLVNKMVVRSGVRLASNTKFLSKISCFAASEAVGDATMGSIVGFMSQKTWLSSVVLTFEGGEFDLVIVVGTVGLISQKILLSSVVSAFEDNDFILVSVLLSHAPVTLLVLASMLSNTLLKVTGTILIVLTLGGKDFGGGRLRPLFVGTLDKASSFATGS